MLRKLLCAWALATAMSLTAGMAVADTVIMNDGRRFVGTVTVSGDMYTIKTKGGTFSVSADDVATWNKEAAPAPADPTPTHTPTPTPTPHVTPTTPTPAPTALTGDAATQLKKAEELFNGGDAKGAIDILVPLSKDSHDVRLLHVLGLAYLKQQNIPRAVVALENAVKAAGDNADRALVINTASAELQGKYTLRAIKYLSDFLTRHDKDVDEQVLNALGVVLAQADDRTKSGRNFEAAANLYTKCNAALEASKPGSKRVGVEWYPSDEADRKLKRLSAALEELQQAQADMATADQQVQQAKSGRDQAYSLGGKARGSDRGAADQNLRNAQNTQRMAAERLSTAMNNYKSPFPNSFDLVAINSAPSETPVAVNDPAPRHDPVVPVKVKHDDPAPVNTPPVNAPPVNDPPPPPPPPPANPTPIKPAEPVAVPSYAAGFPIADDLMVTAASIANKVTDISIQGHDGVPIKASVVRVDNATGLALIRVSNYHFKPLALADKFAGGKFDCAGFPDVDLFNPVATIMPGDCDAPTAANKDSWTIRFDKAPRLPGSPLIVDGLVAGVELAAEDDDPSKIHAVTLEALKKFLGKDLPDAPAENPDPAQVTMELVSNHK